MKKPRKKYARPTFPNAGVEAWYRDQLQAIVREMAQDMLDRVRRAWRDAGLAADDALEFPNAAGVMFWCGGKVLLLRRTDDEGWAFPGGGIEPGEDSRQCALRECAEEIGYVYNPAFNDLEFHHMEHWREIRFATYQCGLREEFTPQLNREHDLYTWTSPDTALHLLKLHPGVRNTLASLASIAQDARKRPTPAILLDRALSKWGGLWTHRLNTASVKIATNFVKKNRKATEASMMAALRDAGFTVRFKADKLTRNAMDAAIAENVQLIKSIPQKYLTDVSTQVFQNTAQGSDLAALADGLVEKYGIAHRRAALIARDQNHKVKAAIERARRLEAGIRRSKWKHSHAGKDPRPTHVEMDGKSYDIAEGMYDPAVDKQIWPGTEINCRCTDEPEIPGFDY